MIASVQMVLSNKTGSCHHRIHSGGGGGGGIHWWGTRHWGGACCHIGGSGWWWGCCLLVGMFMVIIVVCWGAGHCISGGSGGCHCLALMVVCITNGTHVTGWG